MTRIQTPWRSARFGSFAAFRNGLNYSASAVGDGMKLIGVSDFKDNLTIEYGGLQRVRGFEHLTTDDLLKNDDLLFVRSNGNRALIGRVLFIRNLSERIGHSGFTIKARLTSPEIDPLFAALFFTSDLARTQIFKHGSGTNIANLSQDILSDVRIPVPPLDEQHALVEILMTWDLATRQLSGLIAAMVRFKQGMMQQLLTGKRRLNKQLRRVQLSSSLTDTVLKLGLSATAIEVERRLNGTSYDEGIPKLDACPHGWRTMKLEGLLKTEQRPVKLRPDRTYQLVTAKRYRAGIVPREKLLGEQIKTTTQFETKAGDFLISRRQIVHGACGLVPPSLDGAIVSNEYSCLRMSEELDPVFFEYLTHTKYIQRTFYQSSVGVTVEKMIFRLEKWLEYQIQVPPLAEQQRIVSLLSHLDQEIVLLDCQQKALVKQKQGLMQKLLTGEMRVPLSRRKLRSTPGTR